LIVVRVDNGVDVRNRRNRSGRGHRAAGHYGTGGGGYVECGAAQVASAGRSNLLIRSANIAHVQSVTGEEIGDKLGRVATVTAEPFEAS
jgi:hypothetical protein